MLTMDEQSSSPRRSPELRRVRAMSSFHTSSPVTPGPNAFALRRAAAEARSSTPDGSSTHSQRSSKSFSQRRTPTPTVPNSNTSRQTQWPTCAYPPEELNGIRRSEPVHTNRIEKSAHRPTQSNDEKGRDDKAKQALTSNHMPSYPSRGPSSNEQRNARLAELVRQGGSSIANIRRRAATPPPLNLEASKALGQKMTSSLQAVQVEKCPSPKKQFRDRLPFPALKPTHPQIKQTPEPVKLNRAVPQKAAQVLGTKMSTDRLANGSGKKTPPQFGNISDIDESQTDSPLVVRKSRSSNGFQELDHAATLQGMNQRLASIHSFDTLEYSNQPPTPPEKSDSQLRRARSTKLPELSIITSTPENKASTSTQSATSDAKPMRLGQAAYKPYLVQTQLPDSISFHGSIHDKSPRSRPHSRSLNSSKQTPTFQINDYTPSMYQESPFINDMKASYERRMLPSPLHLQERKFTPMEPPIQPPNPAPMPEYKRLAPASSASVPLFMEDQHNPRQSMVLAGMLNHDRPSYETMTPQPGLGIGGLEDENSQSQVTKHTHESYLNCVHSAPLQHEQQNNPANTLSPICEAHSPSSKRNTSTSAANHLELVPPSDTVAKALKDLHTKLAEQETLIQNLRATVITNHDAATKHAKTHSTELTALFKHVADLSERLSALIYEQQVEAQIARQRQQEIYHFMKHEQKARREDRKISSEAYGKLINESNFSPESKQPSSYRQHHRTPSSAEAHGVVARPRTPPSQHNSQQRYPPRVDSTPTHRTPAPIQAPPASPSKTSTLRSLSPFRSLDRLRNKHANKSPERKHKRTNSNGKHHSSPVRNSKHSGSVGSVTTTPSPKRVARTTNGAAPSASSAATKAGMYASLREQQSMSSNTQQYRTAESSPARERERGWRERMPRDPAELVEYEYDYLYDHEKDHEDDVNDSIRAGPGTPKPERAHDVKPSQSLSPSHDYRHVQGHGHKHSQSTDSILRLYSSPHQPSVSTHARKPSRPVLHQLQIPQQSQPIARGESKSLALLGMPEGLMSENPKLEPVPKIQGQMGVRVDGARESIESGDGHVEATKAGTGHRHGKGVMRDYWASLPKVGTFGRRSE